MSATYLRHVLALSLLTGLTACRPALVETSGGAHKQGMVAEAASTPHRDRITQISVINALMLGEYDGVMSIGDMLEYGDFGLGTLDHLDGELIVLDGEVFQVRGEDGRVVPVPPERTTPFAVVTTLDTDGEFKVDSLSSLAELEQGVNHKAGHPNNFVAIRVDGQVESITVRSVKRQEPPYQPLAEVAKSQNVWTHEHLTGTLVGIRSPPWVHGFNVPGFHWHFLSDDRQIGGHVLACRLGQAHIRYDVCEAWLLELPRTAEFNALDLEVDLRKELDTVERDRKDEDPK